jgi:hypothetical protein
VSVRPIREGVLVRSHKRAGMGDAKSESYLVPDQECATCGQSTRGAYHLDCRRDSSGRLLVRGEQ